MLLLLLLFPLLPPLPLLLLIALQLLLPLPLRQALLPQVPWHVASLQTGQES